jgi:hypothetical protein
MVASSHYEAGDVTRLSPECQAILELCRDWRSVAEVSAILRMPLGVARILITDLASEGLVRVEQRSQSQARPDTKLLERVLQGIRRLLARAPWPAPARVRARAFALRNAAGPVRTGPSRARGGAAPVAACR